MKVHFRERYGTKGEEILYITPVDQNTIVRVPLKADKLFLQERLLLFRLFKQIFLPRGYPDSVSEDYTAYQIWDTIQAFCSTICGTLCTHAILESLGVGNSNINAYSATVAWILKDGSGHLGRIIFSWWKGAYLDIESKKWRLRADFLNDLAMCIEIYLLPKYIHLSTAILCCTTVLKAIVGIAGSATRAALTQHQAVRGNLADVSSKDSSQETLVNLIASFVGVYILSRVKRDGVLYSTFFLVVCLHMYANVKAVQSVCLRTFNESRYLIALEEYFKTGRMLTPKQVNKLERITVGQTVSVSLNIHLGVSIKHLLQECGNNHTIENHIITFDSRELFIMAKCKNYLGVYLHFDAQPRDVLKAYFYAVSYLQDCDQIKESYWELQNKWQEFHNLMQQEGWSTNQHLLMVNEYRLNWQT